MIQNNRMCKWTGAPTEEIIKFLLSTVDILGYETLKDAGELQYYTGSDWVSIEINPSGYFLSARAWAPKTTYRFKFKGHAMSELNKVQAVDLSKTETSIVWKGHPTEEVQEKLRMLEGAPLHHSVDNIVWYKTKKDVLSEGKYDPAIYYKVIVPPQTVVKQDTLGSLLDERGSRYGKFKNHADITQGFKHCARNYLKSQGINIEGKLQPYQLEALEMIFHKIGRILNGDPDYVDSWQDIAGYAQLVVDELEGRGR